MINLAGSLAQDIAQGIRVAQEAGVLPHLEKLPLVTVERPVNSELGDYATPVALALSQSMKKPPLDIVKAIADSMPKKEYLGKLEAAAPGFLNIRLNPGWLAARLDDVLEEDLCGELNIGQGQSINLEFISANPTGPLTLGNIRSAFSIDTLANVLMCTGFNVTREYYFNDAGVQIKKLGHSVLHRVLEAQGVASEYPAELYQGDYIKQLAADIAEEWRETEGKQFAVADLTDDEVIARLSEEAVERMRTVIKHTIAEDLHIEFSVWASERRIRASGLIEKALNTLRERGQTYKKDGAEWLRTTAYGDSKDRVLVKRDGEYAYFTPDIAYHQEKFDRGFERIVTVVGADHQGLDIKLKAAMQALGNDVSKLSVVTAQWIRFVRHGEPVKISKRSGEIFTPQELIAEVGYDAARFFMVQHALTTHMDFDLELAKERSERNPVYYVQYAYVRLQSIIRRAKERDIIAELGEELTLSSHPHLTHTAELELLREMYRLPEVLTEITATFTAQALAYYTLDLAQAIHQFYHSVPVLAAEDAEVQKNRLQLVMAARKVLGHTLDLLGIAKLDIM